MSNFPPDIIFEILCRLPVKPLVRFQCVSRPWCTLINGPDFITKHLESSMATNRERTLIVMECDVHRPDLFSVRFHDDDRFGRAVKIYYPLRQGCSEFVGYSNGLVCLSDRDYVIVIWNPLIRKYDQLPFEPIENLRGSNDHYLPDFAFGHDVVNNDYKVLRIVTFKERYEDGFATEVQLYSLRAHSWKRIDDEWPSKGFSTSSDPESLNGALHWLVGPSLELNPEVLVAFDLATEKFRVYPIPVQPDLESTLGLEVLGGWLCVCVNVFVTRNDFWVMKEYGVESSWTRLYTIFQGALPRMFEYCKPLVFSKDGEKVLLQQDHKKLFWYDVKEKRGKRVKIRRMPRSFDTATCVGSLVLLDGDSVIDPRQTNRNKRKRNYSPPEGLNLLVEAMEQVTNQEQEG